MKKEQSYDKGLKNTGAQEVPALRSTGGIRKATVHHGKDLRYGK